MDYIKNLYNLTRSIKAGKKDADHIWAFHIMKLMPSFELWYGYDQWQTLKWYQKLPHLCVMFSSPLLWGSFGMYLIKNAGSMEVTAICEGLSLTMGASMTISNYCIFYLRRKELTGIILDLDEQVRNIYSLRTERRDKWRKHFNETFVAEGTVLLVCSVIGNVSVAASQAIVPLISGQLAYETVLPFDKTPFCFQWWIEYLFHVFVVVFSIIYYSFKEFLMANIFYQLSVIYEMLADDFRHLCLEDDYKMEEEYEKVKKIMRLIRNANDLSGRMRDIVSPYLFGLISISFLMLSVAVFSFLIGMKDGIVQAIVKNIAFPAYCLGVFLVWALIAERYSDKVKDCSFAAYDCNWIGTSQKFQKMLVLYKIQTMQPVQIKALSLYIMNMETLADTLKKTYYFLTLLNEYLNQ